MHFALYAVVQISLLLGSGQANDPFEGNFPTLLCLEPREITGCNETMLDAYKRTNASKSDDNRNEANTSFYLFTRLNRCKPEFLHSCGGRLPQNSVYRTGKNTVIIVPGYISHVCDMAFPREYKDQYLYREDCNVILVDWPWGNGIDYYSASRNTKTVGKQIAFVIMNIMEQTGDDETRFHIIGHSLGAHIAGFAGKQVKSLIDRTIRRITGLDPAGVNFIHEDPTERLDKSDASLVDIIHSNAGLCVLYALGHPDFLGHADFYPNGGTVQFSCYPYILISLLKLDIYYAFVTLLGPFCPHFQSVQYYKESINPCHCQFIGVECKCKADFESGKCRSCGEDGSNCAVMGADWEFFFVNKTGNHSYYLKTDLLCPHCNNKGIDLQGFSSTPIKGNKTLHCFVPGNKKCT